MLSHLERESEGGGGKRRGRGGRIGPFHPVLSTGFVVAGRALPWSEGKKEGGGGGGGGGAGKKKRVRR